MPLSGKDLVKMYKERGWVLDSVKGSGCCRKCLTKLIT